MRVPSIHIKETDLVLVLNEAFKGISPVKWSQDKLAKRIVALAKKKSSANRSLLASNEKLYRKAEAVSATGISETQLFSQLITLTRRQLKHRGITTVKVGDKDWLHVKEIAAQAQDFCNEFGLEPKKGYLQYIKIGMAMMNSFSLMKFKSLHSGIVKRYEVEYELMIDPHPIETEKGYQVYGNLIMSKIGTMPDYRKDPVQYVGFKRAADEAMEMRVSIVKWITAQFAGLEWTNGIPAPLQLYGLNAKNRMIKYAYENNLRINEKPEVDLSQLRKKKYDKGSD